MNPVNLLNKEIRHLEDSKLNRLASILDQADGWKELLGLLTRPSGVSSHTRIEPLALSVDSINLIKQQFYCGQSPSLALLNHWSITGRRRPTVQTLLYCLTESNLRRAADYVRESILGLESPAPINQLQKSYSNDSERFRIDDAFKFDRVGDIIESLSCEYKKYSFEDIYRSTNGFCHRPYDPNVNQGTRIGDGRFSSVFRATTHELPDGSIPLIVAAKLLKSECNRLYLANEINLARRTRHENILELLGLSYRTNSDLTGYICLIYPYIQNGSLLNCLSQGLSCQNMTHLTSEQRFSISLGVARGIAYLHSFKDGPIIHRDIKTANILIDLDLEPKIGDFTLVRQLDVMRNGETQHSLNIIGTSIYMPPEAFRGDISTKFDIFSFGVVILELLTGMRPFNDETDEDLLTYISERLSDIDELSFQEHELSKISSDKLRDDFIADILDKRASPWNYKSAKKLFYLALKATENRKRDRPGIEDIILELEQIEISAKQVAKSTF